MLFSRRVPLDWHERLSRACWPATGWGRAWRYAGLRLSRTQSSPHAIAIGFSAGIFAAFVPVLGIQMTLAATLAYMVRGSLLGAIAGTFVGTPFTYPFMWLGSYRLGAWLLGHDAAHLDEGTQQIWRLFASGSTRIAAQIAGQAADLLAPIVKPLLIGSVILGLAAGLAAYYSLVCVIGRLQADRRARLVPAA